MKRIFVIINLILFIQLVVGGQNSGMRSNFPPPAPTRDRTQETIQRNELELRRKQNLEKELAEINKSLAVPQKYKDKYPKFVKSNKRGIFRLFPYQNCNDSLTVTVEEIERCKNLPPIKGAGSRYSFRLVELPDYLSFEEVLSYIGESDFQFVDGKFVVGRGLTQGIITEIGNVNLDEINSQTKAAQVLSKWKSSRNETEFNQQKLLLEKGFSEEGYSFSNTVDVKQETTYLVRSIAYCRLKNCTFWNTDILVAIRVVGEESDGSIVIK